MSTKLVKVYGCLDFAIAVLTILLISFRVLIPISPYNGANIADEALKSPPKFRIGEWKEEENGLKLKPLEFWILIGIYVIMAMMALCWAVVLVKIAVFPDTQMRVRVQLLGYWLLCNVIIVGLLAYLAIWVMSNRPQEIEDGEDEDLYSTDIPYGVCFLVRVVLVGLIWRLRVRMLEDRQVFNDAFERWVEYKRSFPRHGYHI